MKKNKKSKKEEEWVEYEISPDFPLGAKKDQYDPREIDVDKMKFWLPELNEKYINRWKALNDFFIQYYPGEKERVIKNTESIFSSINLWDKVKDINEKILTGNYDSNILEGKEDLQHKAYNIDETSPRGYKGFLLSNKTVSPTMDNFIKEYPDFFERYLYSNWTEGYYLYKKYIKLIEFAFTLKEYQQPPKNHILKCDKKSNSQIKIDKRIIPIPNHWGWLVIDGIVNEIKGFIEEICNNDEIYIDIETQSLEDIKEILLHKADEINFKESREGKKSRNKHRYIAQKLASIIQWKNSHIWEYRYDATIFIARFLDMLGLEVSHLKELDKALEQASRDSKDKIVREYDDCEYDEETERREVDKFIGGLIEKIK